MAQMLCVKCGERMSTVATPNKIEHTLINYWVCDTKKFEKIIRNCVKNEKKHAENFGDDESLEHLVDNAWFEINSELGKDVWKCPKCETLHIFKSSIGYSPVEEVYVKLLKKEWSE
ncbi:hypothetical protein FACS189431_5620 [Alphaproteobacteria bacterium]|nr:hypothetical protein FACS189431_5620 [Alphaproteobacteria bacterium]